MTRDPSKNFDVRTLERNLRKGIISKKDYEKHIKALPDREANAVQSRPDESRDPEYPEEPAEPAVGGAVEGDPDDDLEGA